MLRILVKIILFNILICQCQKDVSLTKELIPKKVDSLCMYKDFQSKKLFIIQQQYKNDRNFIRISTSEYFDKDSVSLIIEHKEKIIVYYSRFFIKDDLNNNNNKYRDMMYEDSIISIFNPRYVIFELTDDGNFLKVKKENMKYLFQYGYTKIEEEL